MNSIQISEWINGLELWYNQSDYLAAMDCFDAVLESQLTTTRCVDIDRFEDFLNDRCQQETQEHELAPLLVFMAGCHLDAQNEAKARQYLLIAIACSGSSRILAIQEWIASYEDEAHAKKDGRYELSMACRMVNWVIKQDDSHWKDAYQRPGYLYPMETKTPKAHYENEGRPSWCSVLEENYHAIQKEFKDLVGAKNKTPNHWPSVGSGDHRDGAGQHDSKVVDGDWREIVLFGSGASNTRNVAPKTCDLIQKHIPEAVGLAEAGGGEVIFSVLAPKTRIRPHCGTTNLRLTAHLGLSIPVSEETCAIRVADKWYNWKEGRVLVFDDSFEHEVVNNTDSSRAVLLLRFWHPDLPREERQDALLQTLQHKQDDIHRRYNPPIPSFVASAQQVRARGLEHSSCPRCGKAGYSSIRVLNRHEKGVGFVCVCGLPMQ